MDRIDDWAGLRRQRRHGQVRQDDYHEREEHGDVDRVGTIGMDPYEASGEGHCQDKAELGGLRAPPLRKRPRRRDPAWPRAAQTARAPDASYRRQSLAPEDTMPPEIVV